MYKNIFLFFIVIFFLSIPLAADKKLNSTVKHSTGNIELTDEEIEKMCKNFTIIKSIKLNELAKERILSKKPMLYEKVEEYILPVQVDNSLLPAFPTIRDQGQVNSCTAFAVGYYQITHTFGLKYGWNNKDDDNSKKFSPKWAYNLLNNGVDYGSNIFDTYNLFLKHGSIFWDKFPYTQSSQDVTGWPLESEIWKEAINYRIEDVVLINDIDKETGLTLLKHALVNGDILAFTTYILSWQEKEILDNPESSEDDNEVGKTACYLMDGKEGSHAIVIVGYNDDIWIDINENGVMEDAEQGALKIANSWGTSWKNNGFIWLAYDAIRESSLVLEDQNNRYPAINPGYVYKIVLPDNNNPRMIGEFSISHAKRSHLKVTLGISGQDKDEPELIWEPIVLNYNGGNSFDGTTNVSEAVFAFDFTDLIEDFATVYYYPYKWYLIIDDSTSGYSAEIKSVKMIDAQGDNYEISFDGTLPISFDEKTETLDLCYAPRMGSINYPPIVDAGKNLYLRPDNNQVILKGRVIDDIFSNPSLLDIQWSKLSGPGNVYFYPKSFPISFGWLEKPGVYEIQLQASDYEYTKQDKSKIVLFDKTKIWASDGKDNDNFGQDLDIYGDYAVISSDINCVYIYKINDKGEWQEIQKIEQPYNDADCLFGYSVDIDENQLIIGEVSGLNQGVRTGKAYIYEKNINGTWDKTGELIPNIISEFLYYGAKVAISGNTAIVSDPFGTLEEALGTVYVYEKNEYEEWNEVAQLREDSNIYNNNFGHVIAFDNNTIAATSEIEDCIYIFEKTSGVWGFKQKLFNPDDSAGLVFNTNISIYGNTLAISGVYREENKHYYAVYLYKKDESMNWVFNNKISAPGPIPYYYFGKNIKLYQDKLVVENFYSELKIVFDDFIYIREYEIILYKKNQDGIWIEKDHFRPIDQKGIRVNIFERSAISLHENKILYGNNKAYGINAESPGAAYIYMIDSAK